MPAELGEALNDDTWRQWAFRFEPSGTDRTRTSIRCRAIDSNGVIQTAERSEPLPERCLRASPDRGLRRVSHHGSPDRGPEPLNRQREQPQPPNRRTTPDMITRTKTTKILAACAALSITAAACGSDDNDAADAPSTEVDAPSDRSRGPPPRRWPGTARSARRVDAVPTEGEGSFAGMTDDTAATAASNNPLLSTLVTRGHARPAWSTRSTATDRSRSSHRPTRRSRRFPTRILLRSSRIRTS